MKNVVEFPDRSVLAEEAAGWLIRLDADTPPTREDREALREWLQRSPAHREELENLAVLWDRMNVLTELAVPLERADGTAVSQRRASPKAHAWRRPGLIAASGAMVVLALLAAWLARNPAPDPLLASNGSYATAVGEQETARLADGSEVILNTDSRIEVDYGDDYRDLRLARGEAIFRVAQNSERPFRVYAGTSRVQAVGTAFSVYRHGKEVEVTVTEGRVSLATITAADGTSGGAAATAGPGIESGDIRVQPLGTLQAGQVARIRDTAAGAPGHMTALERTEPLAPEELARRLAWRDGILLFSGETLEEVVREISRYTTVSIEIPDPAVRKMRIGGRFPVSETEAMLAALEESFNLRVDRVSPDRVVISSPADP